MEDEKEIRLHFAEVILKQVSSCPHCPSCKGLAEQYFKEMDDHFKTKVEVKVEVK